MPTFSAINLEPEDSVVEEVDTTRELHVDDALKHFQTALKLHSQGPRFFDEAADAYNALFDCDIFKYPDSKTEYDRSEAQPEAQLQVSLEPSSSFATNLDVTGGYGDGSGSSLPQTLYLAYKNRGQFILDRIRHHVRVARSAGGQDVYEEPEVLSEARDALDDFTTALDRDPSDAELWRRTARIAAFLKSSRISRYSLEAAIELDDDPAVDDVEPPSLAEGFAGERLRKQLETLSDRMALTHPIMKPFLTRKLPDAFRRFLDPAPFLPDPTTALAIPKPASSSPDDLEYRRIVDVPALSWADLGVSLVQFLANQGYSGDALHIQLPNTPHQGRGARAAHGNDGELIPSENRSATAAPEQVNQDGASLSERNTEVPAAPDNPPHKERSISVPTRKRSQSTAGLPEPVEEENGDTKRSKRTRRRDTAVEGTTDQSALFATHLQPFQAVDQNLFQTLRDILESLEAADQATLDRIAEVLDTCTGEERTVKVTGPAAIDLRDSLVLFNEDNAKVLLSKSEAPELGMAASLERAKSGSQRVFEAPVFDEVQGLRSFAGRINNGWYALQDAAYAWVKAMAQSYTAFKWSDHMKTSVVQLISRLDEAIYSGVSHDFAALKKSRPDAETCEGLASVTQMLFELHLDVYQRITNPNSAVEQATRSETSGRLGRWMRMAAEVIRFRAIEGDVSLRFLWAAVLSTSLLDGIARDYTLACWSSLREDLADLAPAHDAGINLPNNAAMPEVSAAAANREISKLTTMDFFLNVFQEDIKDPVSLIDTLEPVLNPESAYVDSSGREGARGSSRDAMGHEDVEIPLAERPSADGADQGLQDLWKFLEDSDTELRLFLWRRLGEAYGKISYATKQFSCYLRSIEMVVNDFENESYASKPLELRRVAFVTMLKSLDDVLIQALSLALNDTSAFDIIDEAHLKSTSSALAKLSCLLHTAALFEDEVRVGMAQPRTSSTYTAYLNRLRDIQVRAWSLQYSVLKVGISQDGSGFPSPESETVGFLAAVHQVLGLRKYCKASNKVFLKLMRVELLKLRDPESWEDHLGQVLYDLHGLKLGIGISDIQDHGCPPEKLEKRQAMALVGKVAVLASRMSMRDLLKSDLKNAIDHMQQAIGSPKSTPQMIYNLRNFTEYLRRPIHPLHLYQAMTGNVTVDSVGVNTAESALAKHGWFFLLGMIALTKFKGVDLNRRQTPGATDDLRIGATFLRLQLQFTPGRWDAWFRLAECFDYELDEAVLWTADKMNKDRAELLKFQRHAIHSYTLALSHSRSWDTELSPDTSPQDDEEALSELYHKFGMRLYASSREPFAMEPFQHGDQERYFIDSMGDGTYKRVLHEQMSDYKVWKYAASLFKRAMAGRPKDWKNPYMLAKCLWKMFQKPAEELDEKDRQSRPDVRVLIGALEKTIMVVSALPKPRHGQDPILEPHYKILSVVSKLVMRGELPAQEAVIILQRQPYGIQQDEGMVIQNKADWDEYVTRSLRHLREKDKSNWQHRLVVRHARILFESGEGWPASASSGQDESSQYYAAKLAFAVLRESMFTKTMVMNVWKCDAERPGRHHVYTERYVRFMVKLLSVMNDRPNMEALLRRLRKKGADFYHFNDLWQSCVMAYLKLLRQSHHVPSTDEEAFRNVSQEEFDLGAERVNEWAARLDVQDHPILGAMKDAIELKKLNSNLTKAAPIDDLVSDCYSLIYHELEPRSASPAPPRDGKQREQQGMDGQMDGTTASEAPPIGSLATPAEKESARLSPLGAASGQPEKMEKQAVPTGEAAPKARRSGVRRPDILRKADQAVLRAAEGPSKPAGANSHGSRSRPGSGSSGKHNTPNAENDEGGSDGGEDAAQVDEGDAEMKDGDAGDQAAVEDDGKPGQEDDVSSVPGSVHDSADDESELSDAPADDEDDGPPPSLLFPNLRRSMDVEPVSVHEGDGKGAAEEISSSDETESLPEGQ